MLREKDEMNKKITINSNFSNENEEEYLVKPSNRRIINVIQSSTIERLRFLQNKQSDEPLLSIHFWLRCYLI